MDRLRPGKHRNRPGVQPPRWRYTGTVRSWPVVALVALIALSSCSTSDPTTRPAEDPPTVSWWRPETGTTFHVQYAGEIDLDLPVEVYNLDYQTTRAADVAHLQQRGVASICYLNAGAFEDFRPDSDRFPAEVIGEPLDGWPGERWLDIRQMDVLVPIMAARMDTCREKGFAAVDPDNTDGWLQASGFEISAEDQLAYHRALAAEAHSRGMGIGLKNDADQLADLQGTIDFAVNEECVRYRECDQYAEYLDGGGAVFHIEYDGALADICPDQPAGMSTVKASRALDAPTEACPG